MNIAVTGGAGFIGSHLVRILLERGERVVVIDDFNDFYDPGLKRDNLIGLDSDPNFKLHQVDIRDRASVEEVLIAEVPDVVCHLAARAGVRPSIEDPLLYEEVNCMGTLNVLEAVKAAGLKNFIFASSSSVYGINSKVPFSEQDPITAPISPYAATKRAGELISFTYSHLYGIPVTCLRFFTVYGERGRPEMAVARFTRLISEGREVPVYGDGTAKRDFTYIGDIMRGLVTAVYKRFPYEIINLGGSHSIEVLRLISIIEEKLGKRARINYLPPAPGDVPVTHADVTKAKKLLGFEPEVAIEEGIERYVRWFVEREKRSAPA
jgi:UDP-glucuronate 4-epimerase